MTRFFIFVIPGVLLRQWFSVFAEGSLAGQRVVTQFRSILGVIETMVFPLQTSWVLLEPRFSVFPPVDIIKTVVLQKSSAIAAIPHMASIQQVRVSTAIFKPRFLFEVLF